MKFCFKMRITNIYISWFFHNFFAILTHQEIDWANRPERQIAPLSPTEVATPQETTGYVHPTNSTPNKNAQESESDQGSAAESEEVI